MERDARIQIVLSTTSNQQFGVHEWLMNRAMLPFDGGIAAPGAVDAKDPDAPFGEIARLARAAPAVADELARVVDDPCVLVDRFGREYAEAVQLRALADDLR